MTSPSINTANTETQGATQDAAPVSNQNDKVVCELITTEEGNVVIGKPTANVTQVIELEAGQNYMLNFASTSVKSAEVDGNNLVIKFDNGSTIVLENYKEAMAGSPAPVLTLADGKVVSVDDLITAFSAKIDSEDPKSEANAAEEKQVENLIEPSEDELSAVEPAAGEGESEASVGEEVADAAAEKTAEEKVAEDLAQKEPAAGDDAARLANIEPAAGEAQGALGNSGFGFGSSFDAQGVIPIGAVGPIDPTALQYNLPEFEDRLFIEEEEAELSDLIPEYDVQPAQVLEDGSVALQIGVDPQGSSSTTVITVTGIPAGWTVSGDGTYDPATGTWTITLTNGANYNGGPVLTPPADSDVDLPGLVVTIRETDPSTGQTGTVVDTIDVIVDAVADAPEVDGLNDTGLEGETLDIEIPTALTGEEVNNGIGNDDGSEVITSIVIEAVDPAIDLNDFTFTNANGPVTLTGGQLIFTDRADLVGLTITPKDPNYVGSFDLQITTNTADVPTDTDFNTGNNTASDSDTITLTWKPVADVPEILVNNGVEDAVVLEDGTVNVPVVASLSPAGSGSEILSLTVTGIDLTKLDSFAASNGPNGEVWTRVPGSPDTNASFTITLAPGTNYTGSFTFTPAADSDIDLTGMSATATAVEPASGTSATTAPDTFNVIVDAVADAPEVIGNDDSGLEGVTLDIEIPTALTGEEVNNGIGNDDGSEIITSIVIELTTPGATLDAFTFANANGPVTLTGGQLVFTDRADLVGLTITPKDPNYSGSLDFKVTINTTENPVSDADTIAGNNNASDSDTFTLSWSPTIDTPFIKVNNGVDQVQVKEDHSVTVPVTASLAAGAAPAEVLKLTLTGLDLTKLEGGAAGFVASNGANGEVWTRVAGSPDTNASYTITLAPGTNYTGTFSFTPTAQGDLDLTGLSVQATATDSSVTPAISASASDAFYVTVDAVADAPSITASGGSAEEGQPIAVSIDGFLGADQDGSESITGYEIRGNAAEMANFNFTVNGVIRTPVAGVLSLTPAEADALVVTSKSSSFAGTLNLTAVVLTRDTQNDGEYDTTDNTNSASQPIRLTWTDDDEPSIAQPEKITLDESNLVGAPRTTSVSDQISVDFGDDTAGATITGNNVFNLGGATSNGNPVVVTYNAASSTYTGTAGGKEVFTLTIANNGSYTFTLKDTIDHLVDGSTPAAHDDGLDFTFGFTATDSDGDTANGVITVTIKDDGPAATNDIVSFEHNDKTTSGNVTTNDTPSEDLVNTVTSVNGTAVAANGETTINGTYGVLKIKADGSYIYTINPGVAADSKDTFTYTLTDGDGDTAIAKLEISGAYDAIPQNVKGGTVTVDETDFGVAPIGQDSATGNVTADFGQDAPGTFEVGSAAGVTFTGAKNNALTSHGQAVTITVEGNSYVGKTAAGTEVFKLTLQSNGSYNFTLSEQLDHADGTNPDDTIALQFDVIAKDADGDTAGGKITVNVKDDGPDAKNDVNGFAATETSKDYNIVLVLDVSGSMAGSKLTLLKSSVANLLQDFSAYNAGDVKVHIVPFSDTSKPTGTFTVTDAGGYDAAVAYLNALSAAGNTNYEAPLQSAISWLQGATANDPIPGGETYTYFVSDGEPNRYVNTTGGTSSGSAAGVMQEITGTSTTDTVSEVAALKGLSTVISVGIGVSATTLARLDVIDSNGDALNVQNPADLDAALQSVNPLSGSTSGNVITGVNGGAGAADHLSEDVATTVTQIQFGATIVNVPQGGSANINGQYGTLKIFADGSYTYTLTTQNTSQQALQDVFTYSITDFDGDGDKATLTINISIPDDKPVNVTSQTVTVDESDFAVAPVGEDSAAGTVSADFGNDGPGSFLVGSPSTVTFTGAKNNVLTSGGQAVTITVSGNTYVGKTAAGTEVFKLILQSNGSYTFTLLEQLDHANASNPDDVIQIKFDVVARDADGDTATGKITIDIKDDGPIANNDATSIDSAKVASTTGNVVTGQNGGAGAADDLSEDKANTVTKVTIGTSTVNVPQDGTNVTITGQYGTLKINMNGAYTYSVKPGSEGKDIFTYTLTDRDGDSDTATLSVDAYASKLLVGKNVNDISTSTTVHQVGGGKGEIIGGKGSDILVGDVGGAKSTPVSKDYNVLFIVDVSGSMGSLSSSTSRLSLLVDAVENLIKQFAEYPSGDVKIHFTTFGTGATQGGTYMVTDTKGLTDAVAYLNSLNGNGYTNYEAALQGGINWLKGAEPIKGAETITYFISDGEPNRYNNASGAATSGSASVVVSEINGTRDGSNEIATLQSLSDEVIGVGINVGAAISNINVIDSDGKAINVKNEADLKDILEATNPINTFDNVGGDVLSGGDNNDIIFGDSLYTDILAKAQGLSTLPGAGWDVFARLESGQGTDKTWDRADTIEYISTHSAELAKESVNGAGARAGGHDKITGGAGNDTIFGQEGNDLIDGGAGNDVLYGGSGDDVFVISSVSNGLDTIKDFTAGDDRLDFTNVIGGYDDLQDAIDSFVFSKAEVAGNTVVSVDLDGTGAGASVQVAVLEGVTGLTLDQILGNTASSTTV